MNNLIIITSFKDKWDFFNLFIHYYNNEWCCNDFYINFGYSSFDYLISFFDKLKINKSIIVDKISSNNGVHYYLSIGDIDITFYCYKVNKFGSPNEWNKTKKIIFDIADKIIDKKFNRILNIDCDEYLQTMNLDDILSGNISEKVFHFVEYVPNELPFSKENDMTWCTQGWYYSIIGAGKKDIITTGNKLYKFNRSSISFPWIHVNKTNNCNAEIEIYKNVNGNINNIIYNNDICFHFSTPDVKTLSYRLMNFKNGNDGKFSGSHIPDDFVFYLDPSKHYPIFINNKLKKYLYYE
jgi:hypothetical protein